MSKISRFEKEGSYKLGFLRGVGMGLRSLIGFENIKVIKEKHPHLEKVLDRLQTTEENLEVILIQNKQKEEFKKKNLEKSFLENNKKININLEMEFTKKELLEFFEKCGNSNGHLSSFQISIIESLEKNLNPLLSMEIVNLLLPEKIDEINEHF